jgi:hypothetical protein
MRCIFCKENSNSSKSVEHIIPESLGNTQNILQPGIVCDKCNNYFSREVEKPFLELPEIKNLRFRQSILSKRKKVPAIQGILSPDFAITIFNQPEEKVPFTVDVDQKGIDYILKTNKGHILIPFMDLPENTNIVSRFLAKVALESLAKRLQTQDLKLIEELIDEEPLDIIRDYARRGSKKKWPVNIRRIYPENRIFSDKDYKELQTVHESDILITEWSELFFVLALFGVEYVINYGGPEIDGYHRWLLENDNKSPLYCDIRTPIRNRYENDSL